MQTLSQIKESKECEIIKIDLALFFNFRRRLYEFGLCSCAKVKVLKVSILKKNILISVNGNKLSLQKEFADLIYVRCQYE